MTATITSGDGQTRFREVASAEHGNHRGILDGAAALRTMAKAALACAARHSGCEVTMAKADSIEFVRTIPAGCTMDVRAQIVFQGLSSMTVIVELAPDGAGENEQAAYISGRFMVVAVDADGLPARIKDTTLSRPLQDRAG
ncbi:hotdog domain-containing protein [Bradyrhizobium sp.]|uniref:hotdog domain-containing protein n=1 Tax=Bradyrhizobium sp. TaxID=376 RepID=UPI0039E4AEA0